MRERCWISFSLCTKNEYEFILILDTNQKGISWKADMKLSCGDLASNSYEKLNIGGRSTPRLDEKDLLKALGTELLVQ